MSLDFKQIFMMNPNTNNKYPNFENKLQPRIEFDNAYLKELFLKHQVEIMEIVSNETREYLEIEDLCNDDENMFPRRCELTDEWYVGDITISECDENIFLSVEARFLGFYENTSIRFPVDDYLGLEVWLYYDTEKEHFTYDCINSASI